MLLRTIDAPGRAYFVRFAFGEVCMPESFRLIKKYPNRRLYDTKTSAYITLADVKALVLAFRNFKVIDAKTDDDLTRSILLQIIIDEETAGVPLFTTDFLAQMIRFYGHATQDMLGQFLEANVKSFTEFQKKLAEHSHSLYGEHGSQTPSEMWAQFMSFQGPAMQTMMATYLEQSRKMANHMHDQIRMQTLSMFPGSSLAAAGNGEQKKPKQ
jgi:polyhydroxyalkanoate synthesis repressor PhaR